MKTNCIIYCLLMVLLSGCQGISALRAYSENLKLQEQEMATQQKNFEKVKAAIENNSLEKSTAARKIAASFGEPVVTLTQQDGNARWLYKPRSSSADEKIYLIFDQEQKLVSWEYLWPEKK